MLDKTSAATSSSTTAAAAATPVTLTQVVVTRAQDFCSNFFTPGRHGRRRSGPTLTSVFGVTASMLIFSALLMAPTNGLRTARRTEEEVQDRTEEDWLKSEKDVKTLERIISNLYGQENPFNLLSKRSGSGTGTSGPAAGSKKTANKLEKRFAKHLGQLYQDGADFGLFKHPEGWSTFKFSKPLFLIHSTVNFTLIDLFEEPLSLNETLVFVSFATSNGGAL